MSSRSQQARALARDLSARAATRVEIRYNRPGEWFAEWSTGPSLEQMSEILARLLGTGRYPAMQNQKLGASRHCPPAAWAARAIASYRDGTLAEAIAEGAAYRRGRGVIQPPSAGGGQRSPEYFALVEHVDILVMTTSWPERPSDPADEPVIDRLLRASGASESRMADLLLANDPYVLTGKQPPNVIPLHRHRRQ
jgi:hypothetical protein